VLGSEDPGREELNLSGKQRCWGFRRPHPLAIPCLGNPWGLPQGHTCEPPLCWWALGAPSPRNAKKREVWLGRGYRQGRKKCGGEWGYRVPVPGHYAVMCVGDSAHTGIFLKRFKRNFAAAFSASCLRGCAAS
jgi:hypothetical protein